MRSKGLIALLLIFTLPDGLCFAADSAPEHVCSNDRLRALLDVQPDADRATDLERLLNCLGTSADPLAAAAAAYEVALFHAGADGQEHPDFRQAARWAHRSAAYLDGTQEVTLKLKTILASLRLDYYAAAEAAELEQVAYDLDAFVNQCREQDAVADTCVQAMMLGGEVSGISRPGETRRRGSVRSRRFASSWRRGKVVKRGRIVPMHSWTSVPCLRRLLTDNSPQKRC